MSKELEKMANRLAEAQDALYEAQDGETFKVESIEWRTATLAQMWRKILTGKYTTNWLNIWNLQHQT